MDLRIFKYAFYQKKSWTWVDREHVQQKNKSWSWIFVPEQAECSSLTFQRCTVSRTAGLRIATIFQVFSYSCFPVTVSKHFFLQPNCPPAFSLAKISEKLSRSSLSYKISFHLLFSYYLVSYFIKYLLRSIIPLQPFLVILTYFQGGVGG